MKFKFTSLLLLITAVLFTGCLKDTNSSNPTANVITPVGRFTGDFDVIHVNPLTLKRDTADAQVVILLNSDLSYSVQGDTTTIQAPSHGTFSIGVDNNANSIINFTDATVLKTTNPNGKKKHLNGTFLYTYQPPLLHIYGTSDTLAYDYALTKQ